MRGEMGSHGPPQAPIFSGLFSFFELDFVVNRYKRRHTRHDAKHTIARTVPHRAPAPAAPRPPPRLGGKEMRRWDSKGGSPNTYGRVQ